MSAATDDKRERQRIARQRKKLRQRIERARFRSGRRDWIVTSEELNAILKGEKPEKASVVELLPMPPESAEQVFTLIRCGVRTWDALTKQTRLDDESLGLALADLFNERRIRSYDVGEVRFYAVR